MTFKGKTFRTKDIFPYLVITVWQQLAERAPANRAFDLIATIKNSGEPHKNHTDSYKPRAWNEVYKKGNNFFHIQ